MTEDELKKYKEETVRWVKFLDAHIMADIARQLTCIADAQKQIANPLIQVGKDGVMRPVPAAHEKTGGK